MEGFNPLPSPKQGETRRQQRRPSQLLSFNPLPSPKQGETCCRRCHSRTQFVSIRSPHRSKGRPRCYKAYSSIWSFQSAPLTEARGDTSSPAMRSGGTCFNPLPSPKQGETGELYSYGLNSQVSIRSPHRSKGRRSLAQSPRVRLLFQSAPLTEARGDRSGMDEQAKLGSFNPLPSPKQGETRATSPTAY